MTHKVVDRNHKGQFAVGHTKIGGRKIGSRNRLATAYSDDLLWFWKKYGRDGLITIGNAAKNGDVSAAKIAIKAIGDHLPREAVASIFKIDVAATGADVFQAAYDLALQMAGGQRPRLIEYQSDDE